MKNDDSDDGDLAALVEWLDRAIHMLDRIPLDRFGLQRTRADLKRLKRILDEPRNPAFLIVGRSGSGKSSLINALMGAYVAEVSSVAAGTGIQSGVSWHTVLSGDDPSRAFDILDTRGAGDSAALHAGAGGDPLAAVDAQLARTQADAVLFVCAAANLRENMPRDCAFLKKVLGILEDRFHIQTPVVPVLNQIDQLFSPGTDLNALGAFERSVLDDALAFYREILAREKVITPERIVSDPIPVSSYLRFRKARDASGAFRVVTPPEIVEDRRFNVGRLTRELVGMLPMDAAIGTARVGQVEEIQRTIIGRVRFAVASAAAGVAAIPLPIADAPLIIALQTLLVLATSQCAGQKPTAARVREFFAALGLNAFAGWGGREIVRQIVKIIPGYGSAVSAAVAFGTTFAIGAAAEAFFLDGVTPEEARRIFEEARHRDPEASAEYQAYRSTPGGIQA